MNQYPGQNPYAPPQAPVMAAGYAPTQAPVRVEGDILVIANGATFPPACLKCSSPQVEWRDQRFTYIPPWARYFFGPLIQVLVAKRSRFQLPLCPPCHSEWKKWTLLTGLSWSPGVVFWVLGGVLIASDLETAAMAMFAIGTILVIGAVAFTISKRTKRIVTATKIDKTHTWLRGVHAGVLQGAMRPPQPAYPPQQQPMGAPYGAPGYGQQPPPGGWYPPNR